MEVGILAIKNLGRAKQRLAHEIGAEKARRIAAALAADSLALAEALPDLEWVIASDDEEIRQKAASLGMSGVADPGLGLNRALEQALSYVLKGGPRPVLLLPADLPLATPDALHAIRDTLETSDLVVVPSGSDGGTNALAMTTPDLLEPRFGAGSLKAHIDAAEMRAIRCTVLQEDSLALDLDTLEDVRDFVSRGPVEGATYPVCSGLIDELS